ncbi:hypothetical protein ebA4895 [Aromatoleum aromaticum EbN1]|uniref:Uncharacterized protein n=1 Tax=Aromatoleum aromaticum (strain DSM 19018 / LMG 30748 / EbN1) TaxID=76114 RepID=Q5P1A3_AROAE|nr:hypothetical protein ebA4895 [Aromatoleum aromaticum EbN1]
MLRSRAPGAWIREREGPASRGGTRNRAAASSAPGPRARDLRPSRNRRARRNRLKTDNPENRQESSASGRRRKCRRNKGIAGGPVQGNMILIIPGLSPRTALRSMMFGIRSTISGSPSTVPANEPMPFRSSSPRPATRTLPVTVSISSAVRLPTSRSVSR